MKHEATLNYDDGWIRFWPAARLSKEEYEKVRNIGLPWKRAEQCFAGPWTPDREDFLRGQFGVELEPDDTDLLQVAYNRSEYYQRYSDHAEKRAQEARKASDNAVAGIPLGQPVLLGHYSSRAHLKALETSRRKAIESLHEHRKSEKWAGRAASTVARAERRYTPLALKNRIRTLQSQINSIGKRNQSEHRDRWLDFLQLRLAVAEELYDQTEKLPEDREDRSVLEAGGGIYLEAGYYRRVPEKSPAGWYQIKQVSKNTVTIHDADGVRGSGKTGKVNINVALLAPVISKAAYLERFGPRPVYQHIGEEMSRAEWNRIHSDYKSIDGNGQKWVMKGLGQLVPVIVR